VSSIAHREFIHLGMDVSKDSIAVAVLAPDRDAAEVDKIFHDADSVRRPVKRVGRPKGIWACYEAGPTGYDLQRLLASMGVRCDVVAPSLIPKGSGDRVKTDRRDARRLAGLHRAGQLTPIAIPTPAQEGVRDLCRTRGDGPRPHPGPQSPERVLAPPQCGVARWVTVDRASPALAGHASLR
jgi:transposase